MMYLRWNSNLGSSWQAKISTFSIESFLLKAGSWSKLRNMNQSKTVWTTIFPKKVLVCVFFTQKLAPQFVTFHRRWQLQVQPAARRRSYWDMGKCRWGINEDSWNSSLKDETHKTPEKKHVRLILSRNLILEISMIIQILWEKLNWSKRFFWALDEFSYIPLPLQQPCSNPARWCWANTLWEVQVLPAQW